MKETMKKILNYLKHIGGALSVIALLFSTVGVSILLYQSYMDNKKTSTEYTVYEDAGKLQLQRDSIELLLANEVDKYIKANSYGLADLNSLKIIRGCSKYNIDICFVLAQAQQESHFGTAGNARSTNSVWNVKAYPSSALKHRKLYDTPDESIEPYLQLLDEDYLVDGKTEYDMLNKFVNKHGKRYAESPTYEKALTEKYQFIKTTTPIDTLSQQLEHYRNILGY